MASHDQREDDYEGFICLPQLQKDNSLEALPADNSGTGGSIPFPFLPLPFSPVPPSNMYEYQHHFPSAAVNDLNIATNVDECPTDIPIDQDVFVIDDIPFLDQGFSFPSAGMDTASSGSQTPNNMMTSYHGMRRLPRFKNAVGGFDRNSITANNGGVGNFHTSVLDAKSQNNGRKPTGNFRNLTNVGDNAAKVEQNMVPRLYDSQVRVNSSQPNRLDSLDGRFLSLGNQSNVASNVKLNAHVGQSSHVIETSLSPQGRLTNNSFNNNVWDSLAGIQNNVGGLVAPWDFEGSLTFTGDDCLQVMTSGDGTSPISNLHGGKVNTHHYIPTPSCRTSESGFETDSRIYSDDPTDCYGANPHMLSNSSSLNQGLPRFVKRRMQGVPFSSSVLRSNHQISADPLQNSHLSTDFMLPLGIGDSDSNKSGQNYPLHIGPGWRYTGQTAGTTVKNELPQASTSTSSSRESLKRNLDFPPRASIHDQRRKVMPQISVPQFSPGLLQNALGKISSGHSMPASTASTNFSIIPSAAVKDFSAGGCSGSTSFSPVTKAINTSHAAWISQHPTASAAAFVSPTHISAVRSASGGIAGSPGSLAKTSTDHVVTAENPTFASPPTASGRTIVNRSGSARIPVPATYSKRVAAAAALSSTHNPASATALRKALLLHNSSNMTRPSLSEWRKSLPALAALVKAAPGFRASQVPSSMHHIKFQGFDIPPTVGFKCMLCKRDLSFAPEGPVVQPPIPPAVAVLPCGHTFHVHCLVIITPDDQSEDPPCIPCAMGEE
ncbi:hypothetical protein SOVF_196710 isoform A [Spinacia oleracea]|uniref:RING-type domain-containing protein n=1 Tax=Spinacia oleracea TaxID=3562 RepID=A0A9R0JZW7_SPIOL|nr:uncharacterized protein LOC110792786 [Spinacia oleracea]KNA04738.1 hypothetical protein SOVF_196710 isoform A [Spinacia oleracea]